MIPVEQRIVASAEHEIRGDCYKCCIASVFELAYEDVPHFVQGEWLVDYDDGKGPRKADSYSAFCNWLRVKNIPLHPVALSYLPSMTTMDRRFARAKQEGRQPTAAESLSYRKKPKNWHMGYWIASVKSRLFPGSHHSIVMKGGDVAYDPSPHRDESKKPYAFCGEMYFIAPHPEQVVKLCSLK